MKNTLFYVCLILIGMSACRESTQVNKVNGVLYENCQTPLVNAEVALKANVGSDFGEPVILGTAVSNDRGEFYFTYELGEDDEGTADLLLIKSNSFEALIEDIKLNIDQSLVLFRVNTSSLLVQLEGTKVYAANDTLFYGETANNTVSYKVQPANGVIDTLKLTVPNSPDGFTDAVFYYGLGSAEFNLAIEALTIPDSSFQHLALELKGCNIPDTAKMIIN